VLKDRTGKDVRGIIVGDDKDSSPYKVTIIEGASAGSLTEWLGASRVRVVIDYKLKDLEESIAAAKTAGIEVAEAQTVLGELEAAHATGPLKAALAKSNRAFDSGSIELHLDELAAIVGSAVKGFRQKLWEDAAAGNEAQLTGKAAAEQAASVRQRLQAAISRGAPTYNRGDKRGCAELYLSTAKDILADPAQNDLQPAAVVQQVLQEAVARAQPLLAEGDPQKDDEAAWLLRHAFDGLLELPDDQLQPVDKLPLLEGPYCGTYRSAEQVESQGPNFNYAVKLLDASKLVAGGSIEVEYTNTMHPDPECVGWAGVETFAVAAAARGRAARFSLTGTSLRPGNPACVDVERILGRTPPGGVEIVREGPNKLRFLCDQDDADFVLVPEGMDESALDGQVESLSFVASETFEVERIGFSFKSDGPKGSGYYLEDETIAAKMAFVEKTAAEAKKRLAELKSLQPRLEAARDALVQSTTLDAIEMALELAKECGYAGDAVQKAESKAAELIASDIVDAASMIDEEGMNAALALADKFASVATSDKAKSDFAKAMSRGRACMAELAQETTRQKEREEAGIPDLEMPKEYVTPSPRNPFLPQSPTVSHDLPGTSPRCPSDLSLLDLLLGTSAPSCARRCTIPSLPATASHTSDPRSQSGSRSITHRR